MHLHALRQSRWRLCRNRVGRDLGQVELGGQRPRPRLIGPGEREKLGQQPFQAMGRGRDVLQRSLAFRRCGIDPAQQFEMRPKHGEWGAELMEASAVNRRAALID